MHNRLLLQLSMGLSLGILSMAGAARAEPAAPSAEAPVSQTATDASEEGSQPTREVSSKTVQLAVGDQDTGAGGSGIPNRPMLLTSSVAFGVGYVPAAIAALANSKNTKGTLAIPVVGPWIELSGDTSPGNKTLLVFSGILQGAGALGMVSSLFVSERRTGSWPLMGNSRFSVSPVASRGNYQLSAYGSF